MADNKGADVLKLRFPEGDPSVMLDSHNLGNGVVLQNVGIPGAEWKKTGVFENNTQTCEKTDSIGGIVRMKVVETRSEVSESMNLGGNLSVAYMLLKGSGSGSFLKEKMSMSHTITFVYNAYHSQKTIELAEFKMTSATRGYQGQEHELYKNFGTHYVSSISYGASLSVVFGYSLKSEEDYYDLKAQVSGDLKFTALKLKVEAWFDKNKKNYSMNEGMFCDAFYLGVPFPGKAPKTLNEIMETVDEWEKARKKAFDDEKMGPISATISPTKYRLDWLKLPESEFRVFVDRVETASGALLLSLMDKKGVRKYGEFLKSEYTSPIQKKEIVERWREEEKKWQKENNAIEKKALAFLRKSTREIIDGDNFDDSKSKKVSNRGLGLREKGGIRLNSKYYFEGIVFGEGENAKGFLRGAFYKGSVHDPELIYSSTSMGLENKKSLLEMAQNPPGFRRVYRIEHEGKYALNFKGCNKFNGWTKSPGKGSQFLVFEKQVIFEGRVTRELIGGYDQNGLWHYELKDPLHQRGPLNVARMRGVHTVGYVIEPYQENRQPTNLLLLTRRNVKSAPGGTHISSNPHDFPDPRVQKIGNPTVIGYVLPDDD